MGHWEYSILPYIGNTNVAVNLSNGSTELEMFYSEMCYGCVCYSGLRVEEEEWARLLCRG